MVAVATASQPNSLMARTLPAVPYFFSSSGCDIKRVMDSENAASKAGPSPL